MNGISLIGVKGLENALLFFRELLSGQQYDYN